MQFRILRKSHKRKIIIGGLIIVCVISAITITTTRAKYKLTEDLELAKGTINYKPYDFKVMAMYKSDNGTNYTEINEMPESGYTINESKSYCNKSDGTKDTNAILKTIDENHTIGKLKKNDRCYLYFDKKETTASEILIANSAKGSDKPDFSKTSCSGGCEETTVGTYTVADGIYSGISTYYRGDVTDNYVKFGGFCWRIVRINGDGSIRLILGGTTCHANGTISTDSIAVSNVAYNINYNQSNYVGWTYEGTNQRTLGGTSSNAKTQIESWYSSNLENYSSKIADGKYCNDRDVASEYTWAINPSSAFYYAARTRLFTTHEPILNCNVEDIYILKIGLLTIDEAMFAGGSLNQNKHYYLYNGRYSLIMSPSAWFNNKHAYIFFVDLNGDLRELNVDDSALGLRPVINLKSDITFSSGNGTLSNPYVVE